VHDDTPNGLESHLLINNQPPTFCLPLQEIDVLVNGSVKIPAILDTGSQINVIRYDLVQSLRACINFQRLIEMEGANGATNWTVGCAKNLTLQVGNMSLKIHVHIVEHASFKILLGWPFGQTALCWIEDLPSGEVEVSVHDPTNIVHRVYVPARPRIRHTMAVKMLSVINLASPPLRPEQVITLHKFPSPPPADPTVLILKYKRVDKKVRPIPTTLPKEYRSVHHIPEDPLLSLPPLPTHPPDFTPSECLSQEPLDKLQLNHNNFLWPEELKLVQHVLKVNERTLAWTDAEKGRFKDEYFVPIKIPVIKHVPWAQKNLPIPPGILEKVIKLFREKIATGVYKPSDSSYQSCWFCIYKKSGDLHIVHNLQPLNAVTIRNLGVPPIPDQVIESMAS